MFALATPAWVAASTLALYKEKTAQQVGSTRLTWLIWDVYDAALYSPTGLYSPQLPFVLELTYLRALNGAQVAAKTTEEMTRLGNTNQTKQAKWQLQLTDWFAGIEQGTRLAAMRNADGSTTFVRNGTQVLGSFQDPEFARYFFAIWLSAATLRPDLKEQLLGSGRVAAR